MGHAVDFRLSVLDGPEDIAAKLLELLRQAVFFGRCFMRSSTGLCVSGNMSIGVKGMDSAVAC
jgi:hypothetical protein